MTSPHDDPLWQSLSTCAIGPPGGEPLFAGRLARENGWDARYAARAIEEYRRFCWLAVRAGHVVTPSEDVDQAGHLHMIHSQNYWERFCSDVLGMPFHQGPTDGGTMRTPSSSSGADSSSSSGCSSSDSGGVSGCGGCGGD